MSVPEALFNSVVPRGQRWTVREGMQKLAELQDRVVDLRTVLQGHEPNHAHYGGMWVQELHEPERFQSQVASVIRQATESGAWDTVGELYGSYFRRRGVDAKVSAYFRWGYPSTLGLNVFPGEQPWPVEKTIKFFPMVDFMIPLWMSNRDKGLLYARVPIFLNTTRVEGSFYQIDNPIGEEVPRNPEAIALFVEKEILKSGRNYGWSQRDYNIDTFQMPERGQRLIEDLIEVRA